MHQQQDLTDEYQQPNQFVFQSYTKVKFAAKTIAFQTIDTSLTANYDLLTGADGARSAVRSHFLNPELFEFEQKYALIHYKINYFTLARTNHKTFT